MIITKRLRLFRSRRYQAFKKGAFQAAFLKYWWVIAIILVSYMIYSQSLQKKIWAHTQLLSTLSNLEQAKISALEEREDLLLKLDSFSDSEWIQLTLMQKLGVVPEGKVKIHFQSQTNS